MGPPWEMRKILFTDENVPSLVQLYALSLLRPQALLLNHNLTSQIAGLIVEDKHDIARMPEMCALLSVDGSTSGIAESMRAAAYFAGLFMTDYDPPIMKDTLPCQIMADCVTASGAVPRLVARIASSTGYAEQHAYLMALRRTALGAARAASAIIAAGGLDVLASVFDKTKYSVQKHVSLHSADDAAAMADLDQVLWTLSNVAAESSGLRDDILRRGWCARLDACFVEAGWFSTDALDRSLTSLLESLCIWRDAPLDSLRDIRICKRLLFNVFPTVGNPEQCIDVLNALLHLAEIPEVAYTFSTEDHSRVVSRGLESADVDVRAAASRFYERVMYTVDSSVVQALCVHHEIDRRLCAMVTPIPDDHSVVSRALLTISYILHGCELDGVKKRILQPTFVKIVMRRLEYGCSGGKCNNCVSRHALYCLGSMCRVRDNGHKHSMLGVANLPLLLSMFCTEIANHDLQRVEDIVDIFAVLLNAERALAQPRRGPTVKSKLLTFGVVPMLRNLPPPLVGTPALRDGVDACLRYLEDNGAVI